MRHRLYNPIALCCLLLAFALAVRTYRALREPVVNPDTIRFIELAQNFPSHPLYAVRHESYHPLHAIVGGILHTLCRPLLPTNDRLAWIAAMQIDGVICGSILSLLLFQIARHFGAPTWAAAAAAVLWTVGKRTSWYGGDGISDMLFLTLFMSAILAAIHTRYRPQLKIWLAAGLFAGLAYLTRPEGAGAVLILSAALLYAFIIQKVPTLTVRGVGKSLACLLLGFLVCALPYMLAIGRFTAKKSLFEKSAVLLLPHPLLAEISIPDPLFLGKVSRELWETLGFAPCLIILLALLIRPRPWGRLFWRPLAFIWMALWFVVMCWLIRKTGTPQQPQGYLDGRHTLVLTFLLHIIFAQALALWTWPMKWWQNLWRRSAYWSSLPPWMRWPGWPGIFAAGVFILAILPGILRLPLPATEDKRYQRDAATWIAHHAPPNTLVLDKLAEVGYYSGMAYQRWSGVPTDPILSNLPIDRPVIIAITYEMALKENLAPALGSYQRVVEFESPTATLDDVLVLYARPGTLRATAGDSPGDTP